MDLDLSTLTEENAAVLVGQLLGEVDEARKAMEGAQRREAAARKIIDGLIELFPSAEDWLPEDFEDDGAPRPRGAEAVRRVLVEMGEGRWCTVPAIVGMLDARDWLPKSSNPANAVRSALERLVEDGRIEKSKTTDSGTVVYRFPERKGYEEGEEPF